MHNNVYEMAEFRSNSVKYGHRSEKELSHVSAKSAVSMNSNQKIICAMQDGLTVILS